MPEDDIAVTRAAIHALNTRDVERYIALCGPDFSLESPLSEIDGAFVGESGVRRFFDTVADASTTFTANVEDIRVLRPGRVLALVRLEATSPAGVELVQEAGSIYDIADGRLRRVRVYLDRARAVDEAAKP